MEYLEIQERIIRGMERDIPGLIFNNLFSFEIIDFKYFKNKSKREFIDWYVLKTGDLCFSINVESFNNENVSKMKMMCRKLNYGFSIQYNVLTGYSASVYKKDNNDITIESVIEMLDAAELLNLRIKNINELQLMFGNQNDIKKIARIIQSLALDELKKEERNLVKKMNQDRTCLNEQINNAFEKVLSDIYLNKIKC